MNSNQDKPTCKTCPYASKAQQAWLDNAANAIERAKRERVRLCRRKSPAALEESDANWAQVTVDDWCGEHPDFVTTHTFHLLERENKNLKKVILVARERLLRGIGALGLTTGPIVAAEQDLIFVLEDHTYGEAYSDDTSE